MARPRRRVRNRALCAAAVLLGLFFTILAAVTVQSEPSIPFDRYGHVLFKQGSSDAATKVRYVDRNQGALRRLPLRTIYIALHVSLGSASVIDYSAVSSQ